MKIFATKAHIEKLGQYIDVLKIEIQNISNEHAYLQGQSTENFGHDDAVSEAILHELSLVHKKFNEYKTIYDSVMAVEVEEKNKVGYGKTVTWENEKGIRVTRYCDGFILKDGDMSAETPIARAIWGKKVGDKISIEISGLCKTIEIISIK